ncbi:hypothetical protein DDZ13_06560 [Coraliomargarita sinensis]|uniref:Uncharacterized protein n=1 Tax=Coraliomargarita sinensis TaxID=2174842 RepID=A0A317ZIN3_9BACT|nr:hypothetical protein [Coraliomargarita sinensis]PXA04822.1 hypothetical protein DDZ13_06560 [Coraliomargarita sinensis]
MRTEITITKGLTYEAATCRLSFSSGEVEKEGRVVANSTPTEIEGRGKTEEEAKENLLEMLNVWAMRIEEMEATL